MGPIAGASAVRVEFTAQIRVNSERTVCTENTITLDDDGAMLLHMQLLPEGSPILDLAIQPGSPVGIITAVVAAIVKASAASQHRESSPTP